jgi:ribonuclease P/MRP protein subunit RPP40
MVGGRMLPTIFSKFDMKQFGALKGRSTTHALVDITHQLHQALDDSNSARCLFIDFAKAFDRVDHTIALKKLSAIGVDHMTLQWLHSFLLNRRQRVKIGNVTSSWLSLTEGMPQGTWLGAYVFLALIKDLHADTSLHKFVDDVTAAEVIAPSTHSQMQHVADQINQWSQTNHLLLNMKITKELLFGPAQKQPPPLISINNAYAERVRSFNLLSVYISDILCWDEHINAVCSKANKRLFFLKLLKRSSATSDDLLLYYKSVIRPVVEYAFPVWQSSLTSEQKDRLETIQRRALLTGTGSSDYESQCVLSNLEPITVRLDNLSRSFFNRL